MKGAERSRQDAEQAGDYVETKVKNDSRAAESQERREQRLGSEFE